HGTITLFAALLISLAFCGGCNCLAPHAGAPPGERRFFSHDTGINYRAAIQFKLRGKRLDELLFLRASFAIGEAVKRLDERQKSRRGGEPPFLKTLLPLSGSIAGKQEHQSVKPVNERRGLPSTRIAQSIALRAGAPIDEPVLVALALLLFALRVFRASRW